MDFRSLFTKIFLGEKVYNEEEYREILALSEEDFLYRNENGFIEKQVYYKNKHVFRYLEENDEERFQKLLKESRINMVVTILLNVISMALYINGIFTFLAGAFMEFLGLIGGATIAYYSRDWEEPFRAMMVNGGIKVLLACVVYVSLHLIKREFNKCHAPYRNTAACFEFGSNKFLYSILLIVASVVLFVGITFGDLLRVEGRTREKQIADLQAGILNAGNVHLVLSEEELKKKTLTIPHTVVIKNQTYYIERVEIYTFGDIGHYDEVVYEEGIRYIDTDPGNEFGPKVKLILPSTVDYLGKQFFNELDENCVLVADLEGIRYSCTVKKFLKEYNSLGKPEDSVGMNVKDSAFEKFNNDVFKNLMVKASQAR